MKNVTGVLVIGEVRGMIHYNPDVEIWTAAKMALPGIEYEEVKVMKTHHRYWNAETLGKVDLKENRLTKIPELYVRIITRRPSTEEKMDKFWKIFSEQKEYISMLVCSEARNMEEIRLLRETLERCNGKIFRLKEELKEEKKKAMKLEEEKKILSENE